eukprot:13541811-Heterocapsa_arctica.AAC.1
MGFLKPISAAPGLDPAWANNILDLSLHRADDRLKVFDKRTREFSWLAEPSSKQQVVEFERGKKVTALEAYIFSHSPAHGPVPGPRIFWTVPHVQNA